MSDTLLITAGQYSIAGRKAVNEDSCGIRIPDNYLVQTKGVAAIIADGVSSADNGREASESCVQSFLLDYYSTPESWAVKTSARKILGALNRWLYGMSLKQISRAGRGYVSTLSALIIKSTHAYIFHVGDTRIYRWRDRQLEQLTRDHRAISGGEKHFLTHAMGIDLNIEIDYTQLSVEQGDTFILLTDGAYDFIPDSQIASILIDGQGPQVLAENIASQAYNNASDDNITCQVIYVSRLPFHDDEDSFYKQITGLPFPPPLLAGANIDGFKVLRELHASKRTHIYLCRDIESGNTVVIKTPSINYIDDADFIDRFLQEEWVGRRINNAHVLKVLPHPRKRSFLYYLTEYCEGQTLRQWMIDNPKPSLTEVRTLITQLIHGLLAFHRQEMIHRDIKPENIIIDTSHTLKLIDFGSTRIAGIEEISKPIDNRTTVIGTVNYSAPELLSGGPGTVQSDYYSVGIIAYEMLTGKLPYGNELSFRKLQRAEYRPVSRFNDEIPYWIDGALRKCVSKNPLQRYELLSEFIFDLSTPNKEFFRSENRPLIERNPLRFWQWLAGFSLLLNLLLFLWLVK